MLNETTRWRIVKLWTKIGTASIPRELEQAYVIALEYANKTEWPDPLLEYLSQTLYTQALQLADAKCDTGRTEAPSFTEIGELKQRAMLTADKSLSLATNRDTINKLDNKELVRFLKSDEFSQKVWNPAQPGETNNSELEQWLGQLTGEQLHFPHGDKALQQELSDILSDYSMRVINSMAPWF